MLIAQISDPHLRFDATPLKQKVDSGAAFAACVEHLKALTPRPDVILLTGDIVNKQGGRKNYDAPRRALLDLGIPLFAIPGNHDDRDAMRATFAPDGYLPAEGVFLHYTVEEFPLRLIGLDTKVPGHYRGALCAERRAWLEARLEEQPDRPTVIFMHHPPFPVGIAFMDHTGFEGAAEMEAVVRRFPNVERILCGHLHRGVTVRWGGTVATTAPAISFQMALDLNPGAESALVLEPAACPLYLWREDTGLIGHTSVVGDFGGPQPFHV